MKDLGFRQLPALAIAEGATTPVPAGSAWAWSTTLGKPVFWNGSAWTAGSSPVGGPTAKGVGTVDFGAFPGNDKASVAITGQTLVTAASTIKVWPTFNAAGNAVHTEDELLMLSEYVAFAAPPSLIVAGTGFTVVASCEMLVHGVIPFAWEFYA